MLLKAMELDAEEERRASASKERCYILGMSTPKLVRIGQKSSGRRLIM
jgi:hypothetical protein